MASTIKVDKIEGSTGSTVTVPTGQTFTVTDGIAIGNLPTITAVKGGTGQTSFAAGDILYANSTTTLTKLAKGSDDEVLTLASGVPSWAAAAGGGLCLQVVGMSKTDTESYGTASWAAIPGMTLAITPTKASSKILLTVSCNFGLDDLGGAGKVMFDVDSAGYNDLLVGDAASSRTQATWGLRGAGDGSGSDSYYTTWMRSLSYLHTPTYTLTDVITYKVYWNGTSSSNMYLNRLYDDSDSANYVRVASTMTAMEID